MTAAAQDRFTQHLKQAAETVSKWPVWKQTLLGGLPRQRPARDPSEKTPEQYNETIRGLIAALRAIRNDCLEVSAGREEASPDFWHAVIGRANRELAKVNG